MSMCTRVRPSIRPKSIAGFIVTDAQLLEVSGNVYRYRILRSLSNMDGTIQVGHLRRLKKIKRSIEISHLERFGDDEVKFTAPHTLGNI